jgi:hypothetical protein
VAYSLLTEMQRGSQCYLVTNQKGETAYLELNGRCWPVDAQLVIWLISKKYLRLRSCDRVGSQAVLLTPRGRAALNTRLNSANGWRPPFTREQRLLLATLPLCWILGTGATVFAAEIGLTPSGWSNILNGIAICLPLLIVYAFVRWRGW